MLWFYQHVHTWFILPEIHSEAMEHTKVHNIGLEASKTQNYSESNNIKTQEGMSTNIAPPPGFMQIEEQILVQNRNVQSRDMTKNRQTAEMDYSMAPITTVRVDKSIQTETGTVLFKSSI